jgi:hypothetical protein
MAQEWTLEAVKKRLIEIKQKGFIPIPSGMHRSDDGIVGQILEREFGVAENNIRLGDLGKFELKGIRKTSTNLTLSHKKPERGMTPIQIFDKFGYIRPSKSNPNVLKKKLFVTVKGTKENSVKLRLRGIGDAALDMVTGATLLCEWDLTNSLKKIDQIILVFAESSAKTRDASETFHYQKAFLLDGLKPIKDLVDKDIIVIDFCIDQPIDESGKPLASVHDRGPHIRVPVAKLSKAYNRVEQIL